MIGAFARMLGARERLLTVEPTEDQQGYATRAQTPGHAPTRREARDAPPEGFVAKIPDEGGDVYMVPLLEALRDWVRRQRGLPGADADPTPATTEPATTAKAAATGAAKPAATAEPAPTTLPELSEKR